MRLIVNADDFGYSRAINYGIIDSYQHGILTSTTMMMNTPSTEHAVELAKQNPGLGVGVHLVLTCYKPLRNDVLSLVNERGDFKSRKEVYELRDIELNDIENEWMEQIEKFLSYGLKPTHLDSHHYIERLPQVAPIMFKLAERYNVPVRNNFRIAKPEHIITTDVLVDAFHREGVKIETLFDLKKHEGKTVEVICHAGYLDDEILNGSGYNVNRVKETRILTSDEIKGWIKKENIELIHFGALAT